MYTHLPLLHPTRVVLLVFSMALTAPSFGQTAVADAEAIAKSFSDVPTSDYKNGLQIIASYLNLGSGTILLDSLPALLKRNPYLDAVVRDVLVQAKKSASDALHALEKKYTIDSAMFIEMDTLQARKADLDSLRSRLTSRYAELLRKNQEKPIATLDTIGMALTISRLGKEIKSRSERITALDARIRKALEDHQKNLSALRRSSKNNEQIEILDRYYDVVNNPAFLPSPAEPSVDSQIRLTVSSPSQTSLIDGTAIFIANRIKQEAKVEFFNRFNKTIMVEHKNLKLLFPSTVELFEAFKDYNYTTYLSLFKVSFNKDLSNIAFNLPSYLKATGYKEPLMLQFMLALGDSYQYLSTGASFASAIKSFSDRTVRTAETEQFALAAKYLEVLSSALLDPETPTRSWIDQKTFSRVINDARIRKILLGLIYQKVLNASLQYQKDGAVGIPTTEIMTSIETRFKDSGSLLSSIRSFHALCLTIDYFQDHLSRRRAEGVSVRGEDLLQLYHNADDMIKFSANTFGNEYLKIKPQVDTLLNDTELLFDAAVRKDYPQLVFGVYRLVKNQLKTSAQTSLETEVFLKYGSFMADISAAKSSEDVAKALDAAALPVGSHGIKKRNKVTVAINTFPGLLVGYEWPGDSLPPAWTTGFTAPIGFSLSKPLYKKDAVSRDRKRYSADKVYSGQAITLFLTVVDLAGPVLFRLSNDSAKGPPEDVSWSQLFSPGLALVYSPWDSPFCFMAGGQLTPHLRQYGNEKESVLRFNFTLAFDIPLFNLYVNQSSKRIKNGDTSVKQK